MKTNNISTFIFCVFIMFGMFVIPLPVEINPSTAQAATPDSMGIMPQQISSNIAEVTNVNPINPTPNDDVSITADVKAPSGVDQNAVDLVYRVRGDDNQTIVPLSSLPSDYTITTGYSNIINMTGNRLAVEYRYTDDYLTYGEVELRSTNADFIYWEIYFYNLVTGQWEIFDIQGATDGPSLGKTINLIRDGVMGGFGFYALLEGSQQPTVPSIDLERYKSVTQYSGNMAAIGETAPVDYYVRAVDNNGVEFYSKNNTIYFNNKPTVISFNNLPISLGNEDNLPLNVTVRDLDGISSIVQVTAYYKMESQFDLLAQNLTFSKSLNSSDANYLGTLDLTPLDGYDENLEIFVAVTDKVRNITQLPTKSAIQTISLDNAGPILFGSIQFTATPFSNNATMIDSSISMDLTFTDSHGIKSADILIKTNAATSGTQNPLINSTVLQEADTLEDFSYTIDGYSQSTNITYQFITEDFIGNVHTTAEFRLYVDEDGPVIDSIGTGPDYPTNSSGAAIAYNVYDAAGLDTQTAYYSVEGAPWVEATPTEINYQDEIQTSQIYTYSKLPGTIRDNYRNRFDLNVQPHIDVDRAILSLGLTHQRVSDLKIYLQINGAEPIMIKERNLETGVSVELSDYLDLDQLEHYNISVLIDDVESVFTGSLLTLSVQMFDYTVPYGFDYQFYIPPQENDTIVKYYFELTDNFGYQTTTGNYSVYLDAIPPKIIEFSEMPANYDADGAVSYQVQATLQDKSGIGAAEIHYRYSENGTWSISEMHQINSTSSDTFVFEGDLPFNNTNGDVEYFLFVVDNSGYSVTSSSISSSYINANAPVITLLTDISETIDLNQSRVLRIQAHITDDNSVGEVLIHYSLNGEASISQIMIQGSGNNFTVDIPLNSADGTVEFYITAEDNEGLIGTSQKFVAQYTNAGFTDDDNQLLLAAAAGAGAALILGGAGYLLYRKSTAKSDSSSGSKPIASVDDSSQQKKKKKKKSLRADSILIKRPK